MFVGQVGKVHLLNSSNLTCSLGWLLSGSLDLFRVSRSSGSNCLGLFVNNN
jgi:hypothetical protein